jgi:hypothetical protein
MTSNLVRSARRFALTVAVAGIASVAVAPAAFAADSTGAVAYILPGHGNGPDAFVVTATGRTPVFFCDDVKPGKDGAQDPKDIAKAEEKAANEAKKAADEAAKDAEKADKDADQATKDADKAAKQAQKVDQVMKQHNICLVSPSISRF